MFTPGKSLLFLVLASFSALTFSHESSNFVDVAKTNMASVATVIVTKRKTKSDDSPENKIELPKVSEQSRLKGFFDDFFQFARKQIATGSGVAVSTDGKIITAAHLVNNSKKVVVEIGGKRYSKAKILYKDAESDIALIKIDAKELQVPKIGSSDALHVGEWVLTIGAPFGLELSVSQGIVSYLNRKLSPSSNIKYVQTDVAVNPGNSGGPLFNTRGELVGINSQIFSSTGEFQGVSFAVPVEAALEVVGDFL